MKIKIFYGWWIVAATNIICMLGFGTWLYSFGVFFKPMMAEFGWTRAMTAGAYSLRSIEGGIASPVVGWAVDKYGSRIVIMIGGIIAGFGFILMPFVNTILLFYLIYGILLSIGMSAMLYLPAYAVLTKWFRRKMSRAMAVLTTGAALGGFICGPISALLILKFGWRISFVIIGVTIWAVVLPLSRVVRNDPKEMGLKPDGDPPRDNNKATITTEVEAEEPNLEEDSDYTLKQALLSSTFWILAVTQVCQGVGHSTVVVHSIPALTDVGIPAVQAAVSLGLVTLLSLFGRLTFGYLGDFFDKRYLFVASYLLQAAGIFTLMHATTMPLVYLFILLFGVGFGGTVPLGPTIRADYFGRKAFGKIMGFGAPVSMIAGAVGPILSGYIFDVSGSYHFAFLLIIALLLIAIPIILLLPPKNKIKKIT